MADKVISDFLVTTNNIDDYIGFLDSSIIEPESYRSTMVEWCFSVEIGGVTYIRMGVQSGTGTLLTEEDFQPYFDDYGQVMLTNDEYAALVAANEEEEEL